MLTAWLVGTGRSPIPGALNQYYLCVGTTTGYASSALDLRSFIGVRIGDEAVPLKRVVTTLDSLLAEKIANLKGTDR